MNVFFFFSETQVSGTRVCLLKPESLRGRNKKSNSVFFNDIVSMGLFSGDAFSEKAVSETLLEILATKASVTFLWTAKVKSLRL